MIIRDSIENCHAGNEHVVCCLQINKPAAFTVDFHGARGNLDARVVAPSGAEDEAIVQEVDKGQSESCLYMWL